MKCIKCMTVNISKAKYCKNCKYEFSDSERKIARGKTLIGKIETLEKTWRTIVTGIDETKQIQENARKQRLDDQKRLEAIKADFNRMYHMPNKK